MCLIKNKSAFSIHNENSFPLTYFGKDILILKILVIWFRLRIRYLSYLIMSLESCHRNKRVSCQFCNQSIPRRTKSFKTVIRLTLACALLLYCVNGSLIDISYFHSIPIFIGKLLFWTYLFTRVRHSFPKMYHSQALYYIFDTQYLIRITIFDSTSGSILHDLKMKGMNKAWKWISNFDWRFS